LKYTQPQQLSPNEIIQVADNTLRFFQALWAHEKLSKRVKDAR
jgi:hypothetical protein